MNGGPRFRPIDAANLAEDTFSVEDAKSIIAQVNSIGRPRDSDPKPDYYAQDLARNLNHLAVDYIANDISQDGPTPHNLTARLKKISDAAKALGGLLGADGDGVDHELGRGVLWKSARLRGENDGEKAISHAAAEILRMQRFAEFAANLARIEAEKTSPQPGQRPDLAFSKLINDLAETYRWLWAGKPSHSPDSATGGLGRFPTLVAAVAARLLPNRFTPAGISKSIQRHINRDTLD